MRMKSCLAAAIFGAGVLSVGAAFPAQAHDIRVWNKTCGNIQRDPCGYGQVRDNHEIVDTCDTLGDGFGVFTRYRLLSGAEGTVGDGNGAASGCGIRRVGTYGTNPVVAIKVCKDMLVDRCTDWNIA
jgi:hypothetical protein